MKRGKRISLWAACRQIGGYPELLLNLAQEHDLEVCKIGRAHYVNLEDLEQLALLMADWLNRPRMSWRSPAGTVDPDRNKKSGPIRSSRGNR